MHTRFFVAILAVLASPIAMGQTMSISASTSQPPPTVGAQEQATHHNPSYMIAPGVSVTPLYQGAPEGVSGYTPAPEQSSYPAAAPYQPRIGAQTLSIGSTSTHGAHRDGYAPQTPYDNTPYRFDMQQSGRQMSAADFDAWMRSRGIRVAEGKPAR